MKLVSSEERFRSGIFWVTEDKAVDPDGFEIKRAIVQHRGSAVMMALDEKGRVLLVRQYRLPARASLWELPAGRVDEGEKPLAAARRELQEETGLKARTWRKLVSFWPSPGYSAEKMTIFLATHLKQGEAAPMEDERIETRWFKPKQIEEMVRAGEIEDAKTILGVLYLRRFGKHLK